MDTDRKILPARINIQNCYYFILKNLVISTAYICTYWLEPGKKNKDWWFKIGQWNKTPNMMSLIAQEIELHRSNEEPGSSC